ncbi:hypothetical protein [Changchengzhania lutea]|uniref:hypothetical protein n=1 Tax=Changchengzhania lutea TaxID=2049305 RepID=UPI00115D256F|nr:hypothetical protein [Changchengzhania lutea]
MILISNFLIPKGYRGLTLFPFIVLRSKDLKSNTFLINHEKIHLRQQLELLVLPFYIFYGIEFLYRWALYKNWHMAYINISFEREAYTHENDLDYLKHRQNWDFLEYLRRHDF